MNEQRQRTTDLELICTLLAEGRAAEAYGIFTKHPGHAGSGWELPEPVLLDLIQGLHHAQMWAETMPLLRQLAAEFPDRAVAARLKLAQVLIQSDAGRVRLCPSSASCRQNCPSNSRPVAASYGISPAGHRRGRDGDCR